MRLFLKFIGYLFGISVVLGLIAAAGLWIYLNDITKDLPDYTALKDYEPPVMTRVHAADGNLMYEFARERRLFIPIQAIPDRVKQAFLSAEDKNFYDHIGIDPWGIGRAIVTNLRNSGSGRRLVGASTITQQVAKNFLLSSEQKYERKIKEALLALRIEQAFTKDEILELYLNEIYLGVGAYGVGAASLILFDKSVHELTLEEIAYLAAVPKGPSNYHPYRYRDRAIERRNWVIDRMVENGYASVQEGIEAKAKPLDVKLRATGNLVKGSEYFSEAVRRQLAARYGEEKLYEDGLSVRTSLDPDMQLKAREALRDGLVRFDQQRGKWRGPISKIEIASNDWGAALDKVQTLNDVGEWTSAVVLSVSNQKAVVGLRPKRLVNRQLSTERVRAEIQLGDMKWARVNGRAPRNIQEVLSSGDVIYVQRLKSGKYVLRQVPEVSGALVAMDPNTGRVLALVGGFSFNDSQFNRATQAWRQPGSAFKPFVYAAALDNGYTPSSVVLDAPFELEQGGSQGTWRPKNYGGKYYGPSTLRTGIELSRNVMTVRLAEDMGMDLVAGYARSFGIDDNMMPVLSMSLGAGETTVMRMTAAYSMLANGGRRVQPTLIDRIQTRHGETVYQNDQLVCTDCSEEYWDNQPEPHLIDTREQVLDPMTAYQITSMMEGVVKRGTATSVKAVGRPVAGKTGTTNDERDAWFVGFTPELTVGVFVGYDTPRPMGRGATGGQVAAPIFTAFMKDALKDVPPLEFRVPNGLRLVSINRRTGLLANSGDPGTILEAFKPGTSPPESYSIIGFQDEIGIQQELSPEAGRAVMSGTGGLY
ncbi:Penicillin-binding protein 1A [Pseudovibrio axinellae]|uniref:Penicillin-binding protein 1A n=1 Tax=Pseudovibrio axinellae TaxID=989403 RepID=A0A161V2N8_9HYPH|nr:penicillin-binding protein 1A [Pseudovibrio axinellae]KZL21830.1 Penicillin-binding protein 1A [Pseudovibrio axinellae]SEQ80076.1 penicillin-binding protein 1A [Pseudovibrio axinellae]